MDVSHLARIFRDNVNSLLDERGMSRSELARRADMRQPVVAKILNGDTEVKTDTIERFAKALEVPADELIREYVPAAA
jgi:transcriptional regulator with XRE-family HTH domain